MAPKLAAGAAPKSRAESRTMSRRAAGPAGAFLSAVAIVVVLTGAKPHDFHVPTADTLTPAKSTRPIWGEHGHRISGHAAAANLPSEMPRFFREAVAQLEYLNPEPDRWRVDEFVAMNEAYAFDHYIDLEVVPDSALLAPDRYEYLSWLEAHGLENPAQRAGLLPYHILELYQRLTVEFALWRRAPDATTRRFVEARIVNDAGILGHYVTDGANPHHATIHFNGWDAKTPNPRGFTTDRSFHRRFESDYVTARIKVGDLLPRVSAWPRAVDDARTDVLAFLRASNARVERLYELEQIEGFGAGTTAVTHREFTIERLVAGVEMLRALWLSAWLESADVQR
jgi:hypothetical protein